MSIWIQIAIGLGGIALTDRWVIAIANGLAKSGSGDVIVINDGQGDTYVHKMTRPTWPTNESPSD